MTTYIQATVSLIICQYITSYAALKSLISYFELRIFVDEGVSVVCVQRGTACLVARTPAHPLGVGRVVCADLVAHRVRRAHRQLLHRFLSNKNHLIHTQRIVVFVIHKHTEENKRKYISEK